MPAALHDAIDRARELDARDPLARFRERFCVPRDSAGRETCYFVGNSLGLMPRRAQQIVEQELSDWRDLAVSGHFKAANAWYPYHEQFRASGARVVGARADSKGAEVVMMNSLTVNLHLLMVSFYRPTKERFKILIEAGAFPSDDYAVASQARLHGLDPREAIVRLAPHPGEATLRDADITDAIARLRNSLALVLFPGVAYTTGQAFDIAGITKAAHAAGAIAGFDCAHAAGNTPLDLHAGGADFAAWCSYKYLNSGPGAIAGAFVHEKHFGSLASGERPALAGWWSNDARNRFTLHPEVQRAPGAEAWAISNPPILSSAPLRASLDIFDEATMPALREKSRALTEFFGALLDDLAREKGSPTGGPAFDCVTPREWERRGCQFSLRFPKGAKEIERALMERGVATDFREPDIVRVAPTPLYNTFQDCARFAAELARLL